MHKTKNDLDKDTHIAIEAMKIATNEGLTIKRLWRKYQNRVKILNKIL